MLPEKVTAAIADFEAPQTVALTPMAMIDKAISQGVGVEALEKLLALQERWEAGQGRKAFDRAIADAKANLPTIIKNREVDFSTAKGRTNYRHEDMAAIAKAVDPVLSKQGLSYRFRAQQDQRTLTVTCILSHRDGYSEETTLSAAADDSGNKNHLQAIGSAATYLQRYTLKLALGLAASADDDSRASEGPALINAEQFTVLQGLLEETQSDEAKFAAFIGVDDLHQMNVKQFDMAIAALRKKKAQQEKKQ